MRERAREREGEKFKLTGCNMLMVGFCFELYREFWYLWEIILTVWLVHAGVSDVMGVDADLVAAQIENERKGHLDLLSKLFPEDKDAGLFSFSTLVFSVGSNCFCWMYFYAIRSWDVYCLSTANEEATWRINFCCYAISTQRVNHARENFNRFAQLRFLRKLSSTWVG